MVNITVGERKTYTFMHIFNKVSKNTIKMRFMGLFFLYIWYNIVNIIL